jgi:tetratricopeptide (TPR) repeat protein
MLVGANGDDVAVAKTNDDSAVNAARDELRPPRGVPNSPRQRALLIVEIQQLETLDRDTDPRSADRPQLLMRLGFDCVELETRARIEHAQALATSARSKAKKTFATLDTNFPGYARHDEVLFFLANQYEQAGDLSSARETYLSLLERHPTSRLVPDARLAVAEIFFDQANSGDPSKWKDADEAYREVLKTPAPRNRLYGYASYKLGLVLVQEGSPAPARVAFEDAFTFAERDATDAGPRLRDAAQGELDSLPTSPPTSL